MVRELRDWTKEELLNEARAIDKVFANGSSENLVKVLKHDWLPNLPFYYIDMELCDGNLEEYIHGKRLQDFHISDNPRLFGARFDDNTILQIWDIMEQISSGLEFIHSCHEVHRDLKPRNGLGSTQ